MPHEVQQERALGAHAICLLELSFQHCGCAVVQRTAVDVWEASVHDCLVEAVIELWEAAAKESVQRLQVGSVVRLEG